MTTEITDPWLLTTSGRRFPLINPQPADVCVEDIAHALGQLCRFTGHTSKMYTVAEHCVLVALILREQGHSNEVQLLGLLHDAAEAYVGDLSSPLKVAMDAVQPSTKLHPSGTHAFRFIEYCVVEAILKRFGMYGFMPSSLAEGPVKDADIVAGLTEARDLVGDAFYRSDLKPYYHNVEIALLWAQWLYTHDLSEVLAPRDLYLAVFNALMRGEG